MKAYNSILFPTDFSHCSDQAIEEVCNLAQTLGAELHLLNVVEPIDIYSTRYGTEQVLYFDLMKQMRAGATEDMNILKEKLSARGLHPVSVVLEGKPEDEIVKNASEQGMSLVWEIDRADRQRWRCHWILPKSWDSRTAKSDSGSHPSQRAASGRLA